MAKNNSKNKSYTKEFKDSVLRRLEQNETVGSLSEELAWIIHQIVFNTRSCCCFNAFLALRLAPIGCK